MLISYAVVLVPPRQDASARLDAALDACDRAQWDAALDLVLEALVLLRTSPFTRLCLGDDVLFALICFSLICVLT